MSGAQRVELVISDVDGTLLNSKKVLTDRAQAAIARLKPAGIQFALTSGRPPRGMLKILRELQLEVPIAAFNGGMFFDPRSLSDIKVISEKNLSEDISRKMVERLDQAGHEIWIYRGQDWFVRELNTPHVEKEKNAVDFDPIVVKNFDALLDRVVKIVGVDDRPQKLDETGKALSREFDSQASASLSQPYYLDITHPHANKGEVVRFLSSHLGVPKDRIATLGDMPNDISMFKVSGLSIAMGNSDAFVKSAAAEVTDSYDRDGFAQAIEKLLAQQAS